MPDTPQPDYLYVFKRPTLEEALSMPQLDLMFKYKQMVPACSEADLLAYMEEILERNKHIK